MSDAPKDYSVGYGNPPESTRFQKGKSGNPGGRKKAPVLSVARLIEDLWSEPMWITENGVRRKTAPLEVILINLSAKVAEGLPKASRVYDKYAEFSRSESAAAIEAAEQQKLLDAYTEQYNKLRETFAAFRSVHPRKKKPRKPQPAEPAPPQPVKPRRKRKSPPTAREIFTAVNRKLVTLRDGSKTGRPKAVLKSLLVKAVKGDIDSADMLIRLRNTSVKYRLY